MIAIIGVGLFLSAYLRERFLGRYGISGSTG
jgi:hypothetical protein